MIQRDSETARCQLWQTREGIVYRFLCGLSGAAVYTSEPTHTDDPEGTLRLLWQQKGKGYFNRCKKCGKWVCDLMYNADVFRCVDCAPWENKPNFCASCGEKLHTPETFCQKCGQRLQYKEVWM